MNRPKKILVTTDLSHASRAAIYPAAMLAEAFQAELLLVYIGEPAPRRVAYPGVDPSPAEISLKEFARANMPPEMDYESIVRLGVAHVEIVRIAEEQEADLIVMATRGRGALSRAMMGSTTERVVQRAPCPVLAVGEHVVHEAVDPYDLMASRRSGRAPGVRTL
jgi:nucleotide-binding universal stress UspA family protein